MPVIAGARDPRSIITPDAFHVSTALLGLPLAKPMHRLAAMVIDLAVIGLITLATKSFGLILGVVAAVFFIRAGLKRTPVAGSAFDRAMRLSVGCLGIFIGLGTGIGWMVLHSRSTVEKAVRSVAVGDSGQAGLGDVLAILQGGAQLRNADDGDQARTTLRGLIRKAKSMGMADDEIRDALLGVMPKDKSWSGDAATIVDDLLSEGSPATTPIPTSAITTEVAGYSAQEAVDAYARLLRSGADDDTSIARLDALRTRLIDDLAADTLRELKQSLDAEQRLAERRSREIDQLTAAVAREKEGGGIVGWITDAANQLGFGFGWASFYLTVMLSWWNGQTVGKRVMRIRVLRLDGEPITWWTAFERAGGYAAGFATGLLGFAQVYWDANRQAIHDRIVGTVVVRDGAPKVLDWQSGL